MAKIPVPANLVRDSREVEDNAGKLDQLCAIFADVARPYVKAGLVREDAELKNDPDALQEAQAALKSLAKLLHVSSSLIDSVLGDEVTEEEVSETTKEFAAVAVSSWVDTLYSTAKDKDAVPLSDTLLPAKNFKEEKMLRESLARYPIAYEGEFSDIMRTFAHRLMDSQQSMDLPLNLKLEKGAAAGTYQVKENKQAPRP